MGYYNIGAEVKIFDNTVIQAGLFKYSRTDSDTEQKFDISAYSLGAGYHFSGPFNDGPFILGLYTQLESKEEDTETDYSSYPTVISTTYKMKADIQSLAILVGQRWIWDNGFNLTLGGGYAPYVNITHTRDRGREADVTGLDNKLLLFYSNGIAF